MKKYKTANDVKTFKVKIGRGGYMVFDTHENALNFIKQKNREQNLIGEFVNIKYKEV